MLKSFYRIEDIQGDATSLRAALVIDRDHDILRGHFPGQPVVPGVVMMQIIRELVEHQLGQRFRIAEADQLKFLAVIDPSKNNRVQASVTIADAGANKTISASLGEDKVTYFKMRALFTPSIEYNA